MPTYRPHSALLLCTGWLSLAAAAPALAEMQPVGGFEIDRTEVTVGAFRQFVAATGTVTAAERRGGGEVYEAGWTQKPGWNWQAPFGVPAADDEPAVHVTYGEALAYCRWAGKRLPTDAEWLEAAYTERRASPPPPFETDRTYPYPTGNTPEGANCLGDCDPAPALDHTERLTRGTGHAPAGRTRAGVNGLYDMGANAWEWVDGDLGGGQKITRGGSWWYGAAQMHRSHTASKPPETAVVYIGFRCAQDR